MRWFNVLRGEAKAIGNSYSIERIFKFNRNYEDSRTVFEILSLIFQKIRCHMTVSTHLL